MLGDGGGCEEAARTRVKCAWKKFRELAPFLTSRGASLKLKGKIYKSCVQKVLVYGSETWAMKVADTARLVRTEMVMVRWMCGVTLRDRRSSKELLDRLGITVDVAEEVRRGRLRWFGHVERKEGSDWVSRCRSMVVEGQRGKGRGRKTWNECVEDDMKRLLLRREDAMDRNGWSGGVLGNRLTRASTDTTQNRRKKR
jgi:hypothetical protein